MGDKPSKDERRQQNFTDRLLEEGVIDEQGVFVPGVRDSEFGIGTDDSSALGISNLMREVVDRGVQESGIFNFEFPEIVFPDFSEQLEWQREQNERQSKLSLIDNLWSERNNAVNVTISEVDRRIGDEQVRADLLGRDYEVTPDQRQSRINELFSEAWTESNESRLGGLVEAYGNPEQDELTRNRIEMGNMTYDYQYDVVRQLSSESTTPRRDREQTVGARVDPLTEGPNNIDLNGVVRDTGAVDPNNPNLVI